MASIWELFRRPLPPPPLDLAAKGVRPPPPDRQSDVSVGDVDAVERSAARIALEADPTGSLHDVTDVAYQSAYTHGPEIPDFYDDAHLPWVYAWVRIRDWVDYWRNAPSPMLTSSTQQAFSGGGEAFVPPIGPLRTLGVPFAVGTPNPTWPVQSTDPRGCTVNYLDNNGISHGMIFQRFGAPRGRRSYHNGHDCIANPGDLVVAPEGGTVVKISYFWAGTYALYISTPSGLTLGLGEIEVGSPSEFGIGVGSVVNQGDPVARIGLFDVEHRLPFSMLHFITYMGPPPLTGERFDDDATPPYNDGRLLNPTVYLQRAACSLPPSGGGVVTSSTRTTHALQNLGRAVMSDLAPGFPH